MIYKIENTDTNDIYKVIGDKGLFEFLEMRFENPKTIKNKMDKLFRCFVYIQYRNYKFCRYVDDIKLECDIVHCFFNIDGYCVACKRVPFNEKYMADCGIYKREEQVENKVIVIE